MIDVIVTIASIETEPCMVQAPEGGEVAYGEISYPVTKVHRLEFETEEQVTEWLVKSADEAEGLVSWEQLVGAQSNEGALDDGAEDDPPRSERKYTSHPAPPDGLPGFERVPEKPETWLTELYRRRMSGH
jgi:hypothetical protein